MMAARFRLYNTSTRRVEDFRPIEAGTVTLYVCGMTVYDDAHVGHARAFTVYDAFIRYLRHRGWTVRYVRNFTDIDDKIINRAREAGVEHGALAQRYIDAFRREARDLGLLEPDREPRVTETLDAIRAMIAELIAKGHAYESEGSVWFSVRSDEGYGRLSGQRVDELRSEDAGGGKRHPADFALWKKVKPGEPSWPSPWGAGRPGWHIECSAMCLATLGVTVDIHGGGLDLVFPHHENELAQSICANGAPLARHWMHGGLLTMSGGQKMGKSLGNVIGIAEALTQFPAEALRLYYLQNHYRSPLPWSAEALPEALAMLARLYEALEQTPATPPAGAPGPEAAREAGEEGRALWEAVDGFEARWHAALDEDFNTPQALGVLFELARAVNRFAGGKAARKPAGAALLHAANRMFRIAGGSLGLFASDPEAFQAEVKEKRLGALGLEAGWVEERLAARSRAREARDWAASDAIRDELAARGIAVMDRPEGVAWRLVLRSRD